MARKKKKNKMTKFSMLICTLFFILTCLLIYFLLRLQVMPNKIILMTVGILLVLNGMVFMMLKLSKKKIIRLIPILGCGGLFYGVYTLANTNNILTSMNVNYKTSNYALIVKKDSKYEELDDLTDKEISYLTDDKEMLDKIKIKHKSKEYQDPNEMANDLLDGKTDSIILEQSYIDILSDSESSIENFKDKIKIIYNFEINTKVTDIKKDVNVTKDTFVIYISGIDTYGSVSSVSRTDANMLAVVNPNTRQILLVSIPRDYYVDLAGKNAKDKFTHSGIYGIDTSVKTLENLLDIDINYYFKINFTSLIKIVDSVGGVDVYSKYTFTSKDGYNYTSGYNHVNGKEALSFVRERKTFAGGDRVRNMNQQALIEALLRKCTNKSIITKYNSLLNSLKSSFITNMPSNSLTAIIKKQMDDGGKWNVSTVALDGTGSSAKTYSIPKYNAYVMIPNQETITNAKKMIQDVYDGKKLESSFDEDATNVKNVTQTQKKVVETPTTTTSNEVSNSTAKESKKYTITYVIDDKETTSTVEEGGKLVLPAIPSKEGYVILGWFIDANLYDENTKVDKDMTLVAKYKKKEVVEESNSNEIVDKSNSNSNITSNTTSNVNSNTEKSNSNSNTLSNENKEEQSNNVE